MYTSHLVEYRENVWVSVLHTWVCMKYYFTKPFIQASVPWGWQDSLSSNSPPPTPTPSWRNYLLLSWLVRQRCCSSTLSPTSGQETMSLANPFFLSLQTPLFLETLALGKQKAERLAGFLSYPFLQKNNIQRRLPAWVGLEEESERT